jgi:hypothetical protein
VNWMYECALCFSNEQVFREKPEHQAMQVHALSVFLRVQIAALLRSNCVLSVTPRRSQTPTMSR